MRLGEEREQLRAAGQKAGRAGSSVGRNQRRTLVKQEDRVRAALAAAETAEAAGESSCPAADVAWRCRTCGSTECDGLCFGLWKQGSSSKRNGGPATVGGAPSEGGVGFAVRVGDRVTRGPDWHWADQDGGAGRLGTIVEVKSWAANSRCVCAHA